MGSGPTLADEAHANLIRRFYTAANTLLATGNIRPLQKIVAFDLAEHPPRIGPYTGRAGLITSLHSLAATFPGLRLVLDEVRETSGGSVVAFVHAEGTTGGSFLGLPLPSELAAWGPLEVFRVESGLIVEHWGSGPDPARFTDLWETAFEALRPTAGVRVDLVVARLTINPGARWMPPHDGGTRVLLVEEGSLVVTTDSKQHLSPGTVFVNPAGSRMGLDATTEASEPVVVLIISAVATAPHDITGIDASVATPAAAVPSSTPGVTFRVLTVSRGVMVPPGARLMLGQAMFDPGRGLELAAAPIAVLLTVEAGTVAVVTTEGETTNQDRLAVGEGAAFDHGDAGWWRVVGQTPATLLILTITLTP